MTLGKEGYMQIACIFTTVVLLFNIKYEHPTFPSVWNMKLFKAAEFLFPNYIIVHL